MSLQSCRLCLKESKDAVDIFSDSCKKINYQLKIRAILCVSIEASDNLRSICPKCARDVTNFFNFWLLVKYSQTKLNQRNDHDYVSMDNIKKEPHDGDEKNKSSSLQVDNGNDFGNNKKPFKYTILKANDHVPMQCYQVKAEVNSQPGDGSLSVQDISIKQEKVNIELKKNSQGEKHVKDNCGRRQIQPQVVVPKGNLAQKLCNKIIPLPPDDSSSIKGYLNKEDYARGVKFLKPIVETSFDFSTFPKKVLNNGKLIFPKPKWNKLVSRFYNLQCPLCNVKFPAASLLREHMQVIHKVRGYVTCYCGQRIYSRSLINYHMAKHLEPSAFECNICKKSLSKPAVSKVHLETHSKERKFKCLVCNTRHKGGLIYHKQKVHGQKSDKNYKCEICKTGFKKQSNLEIHKETCKSSKSPFLCSECGHVVQNKARLRAHMMTYHDTTGKYKTYCKQCGLMCQNQFVLAAHRKSHLNYNCSQCSFTTSKQEYIDNHTRNRHTNPIQFFCNNCGKGFRGKKDLKRHMLQHSGQVKYSCPYCPRKYLSCSGYWSHQKIAHSTEYLKGYIKRRNEKFLPSDDIKKEIG